jgi:hypothetical protein
MRNINNEKCVRNWNKKVTNVCKLGENPGEQGT